MNNTIHGTKTKASKTSQLTTDPSRGLGVPTRSRLPPLIGDSDDAHLLRTNAGATRMTATVSQAKDIAKGVNVTKLLDIAHERGDVKTTTPAARACWLYLLKKSYVASGLMLYSHDYAWAGGFEFEAKDGWTTITYKELDPANPLDEDFDPQKEDTDDCSDIDFQVIDEALASGVLDPNGPEHEEIVKLLGLEVQP